MKIIQYLCANLMIGVFDSGLGGLTILKSIRRKLPQYDYLFVGDNARAPYGTRSFEVVYEYTLQAVKYLFAQGCPLVILACNTASAKALRTIQQNDLPLLWKERSCDTMPSPQLRRVLGIIRPTAEKTGDFTLTRHVGILATPGTITSCSYPIEINKLYPDISVVQQACPMWVPLVENGEHNQSGADYFVDKYVQEILRADSLIDTLLLGCTHYPLLQAKIEASVARYATRPVRVIAQGDIIADSLADYLRRHTDLAALCTKGGELTCQTTESAEKFSQAAGLFMKEPVVAQHINL